MKLYNRMFSVFFSFLCFSSEIVRPFSAKMLTYPKFSDKPEIQKLYWEQLHGIDKK